MDEHHAAGEFRVKLFGWSQERRFVVVRERIRETKAAVGRRLIDVPGYTFRVRAFLRQAKKPAHLPEIRRQTCSVSLIVYSRLVELDKIRVKVFVIRKERLVSFDMGFFWAAIFPCAQV